MTLAMKPTITVSYYAIEEPTVELPDTLKQSVVIKFVDLMEKDFLVLDHGGVKVYRTYKDEHEGVVEEWSEYWLSTAMWTSWESDACFDSRDLQTVPAEALQHYQALYPDSPLKQILAYSIDRGLILPEE